MRRPLLLSLAVLLVGAALPPSAPAAGPTDPQLTIYAGDGTQGAPVPGPALASPRSSTSAMDVTADGTLYALDLVDHVVERITPDGELTIVAGDGTADPFTAGPARSSGLGGLTYALAAEDDGTLYVGDWGSGQIARITPDGRLSVFAGDGTRGLPVDGPATSSPLGYVVGLDTDAAGNVFFALQDQFAVVRITPGGTLTRIAGTGDGGPMTDGPALASTMVPRGGTVLPDGTYYVSSGIPSIARIADGDLRVVDTTISTPVGMSHDEDGRLYVASNAGARITRLGADGSAPTPVAGDMTNGLFAFTPGDPLASSFFSTVVAADPSGVVYTIDYPKQIGRVGPAVPSRPRAVTAVAGPDGAVTVGFVPPANRGLTAITGYEVSADGGDTWAPLDTTAAPGGRRTGRVEGLAVGTHAMQVRARNASGAGFVPAQPRTVVVAPAAPAETPGAPEGPVGTPAAAQPAPATTPAAVATPPARPAAPAKPARPVRRAPSVCTAKRRVRLHWRVRRGTPVRAVTVTVDGRRVHALPGDARSAVVTVMSRRTRVSTVRIVATTTGGRRLTSTRTYRLCAPRRARTLPTTVLRPAR
ncbi:hypothetical protein [Patulibacter sp. SYSU D01012]|uniref:hypothetical protein n=1 Tax=Patulibacter sp. SYSU D01012 TaxID=2817381 RepID=UPI001B318057|nr:hypothetical protein [Patulibacter sp. SYSU D01012]